MTRFGAYRRLNDSTPEPVRTEQEPAAVCEQSCTGAPPQEVLPQTVPAPENSGGESYGLAAIKKVLSRHMPGAR